MRNCLARRHWAFKEIHILHRAVAEVKKEVIVNFGLTARQFNGLNVQLDQAVECWREGLKFQVANLDERIKALPKTIAILEKKIAKEQKLGPEASHRKIDRWWFSIHQKKRHLAACESRVDNLLVELAGPPRICFGGRKLLKSGQIEEWREKRRSQIFLVGSSDETAGNQSSVGWGKFADQTPGKPGRQTSPLEGGQVFLWDRVLEEQGRAGLELATLQGRQGPVACQR